MRLGRFSKQPYESFVIAANFADNMDIDGGEDLVLGDCTVTAVDKDDEDVTSTVLDTSTKAIGTGTEKGQLKILCRAGTVAASPYKITFRGTTSDNEKWEKDVEMKIKEI